MNNDSNVTVTFTLKEGVDKDEFLNSLAALVMVPGLSYLGDTVAELTDDQGNTITSD